MPEDKENIIDAQFREIDEEGNPKGPFSTEPLSQRKTVRTKEQTKKRLKQLAEEIAQEPPRPTSTGVLSRTHDSQKSIRRAEAAVQRALNSVDQAGQALTSLENRVIKMEKQNLRRSGRIRPVK